MATTTPPPTTEHPIWEGNPSHWNNFGAYVLSVILLPVFGLGLILFLVKYLELRYTRYRLTDQRLQLTIGVFSRTTKNLELYRVKDLRLERSFLQRMAGIGTIAMVTSDFTMKHFNLEGVRESEHLFEEMRRAVETLRIARGVREIDQNDRITP
jgi:uncharacterized membrane protein YdbT with pleckstrin-like domain